MSTSIARVHSKERKLHSIFSNPLASRFWLLLVSWSEDYISFKGEFILWCNFFPVFILISCQTLWPGASHYCFSWAACLLQTVNPIGFIGGEVKLKVASFFTVIFFPVPSNKWALEESLSVSFGFCPGEVSDFAPCNINSLSWILTDWTEPVLFIVIWFHNSCFNFTAWLIIFNIFLYVPFNQCWLEIC